MGGLQKGLITLIDKSSWGSVADGSTKVRYTRPFFVDDGTGRTPRCLSMIGVCVCVCVCVWNGTR